MDKLRLFKNKSEVFKCQFKLDGIDAEETRVRLCLEFDDNKNLFFHGEINEDGSCLIPLPALKEVKKNTCKLSIEAIADSTYFKVYEADVEFKNSVEVKLSKLESSAEQNSKRKAPKVQLEQVEANATTVSEPEVPVEEPQPVEENVTPPEPPKEKSSNPYISKTNGSWFSSYEQFKKQRAAQ